MWFGQGTATGTGFLSAMMEHANVLSLDRDECTAPLATRHIEVIFQGVSMRPLYLHTPEPQILDVCCAPA